MGRWLSCLLGLTVVIESVLKRTGSFPRMGGNHHCKISPRNGFFKKSWFRLSLPCSLFIILQSLDVRQVSSEIRYRLGIEVDTIRWGFMGEGGFVLYVQNYGLELGIFATDSPVRGWTRG